MIIHLNINKNHITHILIIIIIQIIMKHHNNNLEILIYNFLIINKLTIYHIK
jgi:hypothetical protein